MISGNWHSDVKKSEYLKVYKNINKIGHPESAAEMRQLNKEFDRNYKTRRNNRRWNTLIVQTVIIKIITQTTSILQIKIVKGQASFQSICLDYYKCSKKKSVYISYVQCLS